MAPINWCTKCSSQNEIRLETIGKRSLCEWCDKKTSPPSMFKVIKKLQTKVSSEEKHELMVKIQCDACDYTELIPLSEFPTFSRGYFIDMSILDNLICKQCFDKPMITIFPFSVESL